MTLIAVAKVYYITALVAVVLFSAHCDGGPKRQTIRFIVFPSLTGKRKKKIKNLYDTVGVLLFVCV